MADPRSRFRTTAAWLALGAGLVGLLFLLGVFGEVWPAISFGLLGLVAAWVALYPFRRSAGPEESGRDGRSRGEPGESSHAGPSRWLGWVAFVLSMGVTVLGLLLYAGLFVLASS